jgi:hypothetical protein
MDIDRIAARPADYLTETGLTQLQSGTIFFVIGIFSLIHGLLPIAYRYYGLAAQNVGILCAAAVFWKLSVIKKSIVFPRGGYVEPQVRAPAFWVVLFVALGVAVGFAFVALRPDLALAGIRIIMETPLIWPGFAILFAILCATGGWRKSRLMVWFGIYFACLAPLLWLLPVNNYVRSAVLETAAGAPMAIVGGIRLRRFVRANPIPPPDSVNG